MVAQVMFQEELRVGKDLWTQNAAELEVLKVLRVHVIDEIPRLDVLPADRAFDPLMTMRNVLLCLQMIQN